MRTAESDLTNALTFGQEFTWSLQSLANIGEVTSRPPPSKENPVALEGVWGDLPPELGRASGLRLVVAVFPERHMQRMMEVNFSRIKFEVACYASLDEIPFAQPEPALLVFDSDHFTDMEVMEFRRGRAWDRVMVKASGQRRSDYDMQRARGQMETRWWIAMIIIAFLLAVLSFLVRR